jgi:nucleoside-diphosphate-sugar epimerase
MLSGEARIEGAGQRILNLIHQDDVVGCIQAALRSGKAGEVYNATDDEPVAQREFLEWLARKLGQPLPASVPEDALAARKRGLTSKRVLNHKLKLELGYRFKYPTFREGYPGCFTP